MGESLVTEVIGILVSGIGELATGIGTGLGQLVQAMFLETTTTGTKLSTFGTVIVVFAGISLAVGLSRFVLQWVMSLGRSK